MSVKDTSQTFFQFKLVIATPVSAIHRSRREVCHGGNHLPKLRKHPVPPSRLSRPRTLPQVWPCGACRHLRNAIALLARALQSKSRAARSKALHVMDSSRQDPQSCRNDRQDARCRHALVSKASVLPGLCRAAPGVRLYIDFCLRHHSLDVTGPQVKRLAIGSAASTHAGIAVRAEWSRPRKLATGTSRATRTAIAFRAE